MAEDHGDKFDELVSITKDMVYNIRDHGEVTAEEPAGGALTAE